MLTRGKDHATICATSKHNTKDKSLSSLKIPKDHHHRRHKCESDSGAHENRVEDEDLYGVRSVVVGDDCAHLAIVLFRENREEEEGYGEEEGAAHDGAAKVTKIGQLSRNQGKEKRDEEMEATNETGKRKVRQRGLRTTILVIPNEER